MSIQRTRLELVAVRGPLGGARLPLRLGENVVGRDDWVDLPVVSSAVSRRHAVVRVRVGGHVVVQDLASRNGTRLNGVRVDDEMLVNLGDVIEVGDVALQLVEIRPAAVDGGPHPNGAADGAASTAPWTAGGRGDTGRPRPAWSGAMPPSIEHSTPTGLIPRVPPLPAGPVPGVGAPRDVDRPGSGSGSVSRRAGREGAGAGGWAADDAGRARPGRGPGAATGGAAGATTGGAAGAATGGAAGAATGGAAGALAGGARRAGARPAPGSGGTGRSGAPPGTAVLHLLAAAAVLGALVVAVTSDGRVRGLALTLVLLAALVAARRFVVRRVRR